MPALFTCTAIAIAAAAEPAGQAELSGAAELAAAEPAGAAELAGAAEQASAAELAGQVDFQAGIVEADPSSAEVTLRDGVVVTYEGFRITGKEIRLKRSPAGIDLHGRARVALCPCEPSPIAVRLAGARVEPPGELYAYWPQIELFGIPLLTLPWLWIRPFNRVGLTPPIVVWRGDDGLLAGAGVHLPFAGTGGMRSLDVTAAGYFRGGAEVTARLHTPESTARLEWDHLRSSRVVLDAHGSSAGGDVRPRLDDGAPGRDERALRPKPRLASLAWDIDFVRGPRARSATVDLGPAAQPFDFGQVETAIGFVIPNGGGGLASTGIAARGFRGEGAMVAGPLAAAGVSGPLSAQGSWDGELSGGFLGGPFARGALGLELDLRPGPAELRIGVRGRARAASDATQRARQDAALGAGAELRLPFVRAYHGGTGKPPVERWGSGSRRARPPPQAPVLHWLIPTLQAQGAAGASSGSHPPAPHRRLAPLSWLGAAGLSSALGPPYGSAFGIVVRMGLLGEHGSPALRTLAMAHARVSAQSAWISARVEAAAVTNPTGQALTDAPAGVATTAELRLGPLLGASLLIDLAGEHGKEARAARRLAFGLAALPGEEQAYTERPGWTAGSELVVPWSSEVNVSMRADADLTAPSLLALGSGVTYQDRSGCLTLGVFGSGRLGREGIDVRVSAGITPPSRRLR